MVYSILVYFLLSIGPVILAYTDVAIKPISFGNNIETVLNMQPENNIWEILTDISIKVFQYQNKDNYDSTIAVRSITVAIVCGHSMWRAAVKFIDNIAMFQQGTEFIYLELAEDNSSVNNITRMFDNLMQSDTKINTIVLFFDDQELIVYILKTISSFIHLRWTGIIHITEWIIVASSSGLLNELKNQKLTIDFITLILHSGTDLISIVQKSREGNFKQTFTYKICNSGKLTCSTDSSPTEDPISYLKKTEHLRLHPLLYLKTKKSIMDGLNIPAAISVRNYERISYTKTVGNVTSYGGFTIELLRIMATVLGFTCRFVTVYDGGGYGEALDNGTVTGITGLLSRRETGIAALVTRLPNRESVIDFLPTILMEETTNIVYRLPQAGESLDLTYIKIIQPGYLLSLVGPVIMIAILGALVHVATRECSSPRPRKFSKRDLRRLRSFPSHIFFLGETYSGQTGRILIGTWGTFCLILWSAYSAYLVTTFATKPNELTINSFDQLVQHSEFRIGMLGSGNALAIILKTSNVKSLQKIWSKVVENNKSDPSTFSLDLADHVRRITAGRYAFIDNFSIASGLFYDYLPSNYTDVVRAYPQTSIQETEASYVAVPKHVFYREALYNLHLELEMAGIILQLRKVYFSQNSQAGSRAKHEGNVVDFGRIEFLVYVVLAGIFISFVCLVAELSFARWKRKKIMTKH